VTGSLRWNAARKQWQADVRVGGRRLRPLVGTDRKVADAILDSYRQRALLARHGIPVWVAGVAPRLRDYAPRVLERWDVSRLSRATVRIRSQATNRFLVPRLGDLLLTGIDRDAIQAHITARLHAGAATSSVRNEVDALRLLLKAAVEDGLLPGLPRFPGLARPRAPERYLTEEEIERLFVACAVEPPLRLFAWVALTTGLRVSSIMALERRDVNLERGFIRVRVVKGGERLNVPLDPRLADELRAAPGPAGSFLVQTPGKVNRIDWARMHLRRAGDRAQVPGVHPHLLRHTLATWLNLTGTPSGVTRDLLGHTSLSMTNRYVHAPPDAQRAAMERLPWVAKATAGQHLRPVTS